MVHDLQIAEWTKVHTHILQLETEGYLSRTFRRLDPKRQGEIILAILAEATEKGPTRLNIKEVARRAGVAVGSLYTYFPSRDGLLDFIVELVARFMRDDLESYRRIILLLPLREALQVYLSGGIEWSQLYSGFVQLFGRAAYQGDPELQERLVRPVATILREIIHDMLAQAIERGEIRPDIDLEATTRVIHTLTIGIGDSQLLPYLNTYFQVSDETITPEQTTDAMLEIILYGIGNLTSDT